MKFHSLLSAAFVMAAQTAFCRRRKLRPGHGLDGHRAWGKILELSTGDGRGWHQQMFYAKYVLLLGQVDLFGLTVRYGLDTDVANDAHNFNPCLLADIDIELEFGEDDSLTNGIPGKVTANNHSK
jgi:hypothetical protein